MSAYGASRPVRRDETSAAPEPAVLRAGKKFHSQVQRAFAAGLMGLTVSDISERTLLWPNGGRERADILLLQPEHQENRIVMEIKSTVWREDRPPQRQRALLLRHLRQLDGYLDLLLDDLGETVHSVSAVLLYPSRPSDKVVEELEAVASRRGVMIVFFDEMDWRS